MHARHLEIEEDDVRGLHLQHHQAVTARERADDLVAGVGEDGGEEVDGIGIVVDDENAAEANGHESSLRERMGRAPRPCRPPPLLTVDDLQLSPTPILTDEQAGSQERWWPHILSGEGIGTPGASGRRTLSWCAEPAPWEHLQGPSARSRNVAWNTPRKAADRAVPAVEDVEVGV